MLLSVIWGTRVILEEKSKKHSSLTLPTAYCVLPAPPPCFLPTAAPQHWLLVISYSLPMTDNQLPLTNNQLLITNAFASDLSLNLAVDRLTQGPSITTLTFTLLVLKFR